MRTACVGRPRCSSGVVGLGRRTRHRRAGCSCASYGPLGAFFSPPRWGLAAALAVSSQSHAGLSCVALVFRSRSEQSHMSLVVPHVLKQSVLSGRSGRGLQGRRIRACHSRPCGSCVASRWVGLWPCYLAWWLVTVLKFHDQQCRAAGSPQRRLSLRPREGSV